MNFKNTHFANEFSFHNIISELLQLFYHYKKVMNNCENYELNYIQKNKSDFAFSNCKWIMVYFLRSTLTISKQAQLALLIITVSDMLTFENI